ncbi:MAG: complex I NDUFA9 subunit family protein, partial [Chloroflexi bacterium]|nr:complex I NDUFA9 subunit family protein [Chloroflexota bacterium]
MILVTGPTGYVGRRIVTALASRGYPFRCLIHTPSRSSFLQLQNVETVEGDIMNPNSMVAALRGVDTVIHLVAVIRKKGGSNFERVNHLGTRNTLKAAKEAGVKRFLHASTIGAADYPSISYLHSRWLGEQEVINSDIPFTILRFSLGFGEGDEFFNVLAALVKALPVVPVIGNGKARFQPIAVEEVAECFVRAYEDSSTIGKTIEIGGPEYLSYEEIIDLISQTLNIRIAKVHVPVTLVRPLVKVMEVLTPHPPVTSEQLKMLKIDNITKLDAVEKNFGFRPMTIQGKLDYIKKISYLDALKMNLGVMPT